MNSNRLLPFWANPEIDGFAMLSYGSHHIHHLTATPSRWPSARLHCCCPNSVWVIAATHKHGEKSKGTTANTRH